jgi:hypothetical protein
LACWGDVLTGVLIREKQQKNNLPAHCSTSWG